jgi:hypothetical protein
LQVLWKDNIERPDASMKPFQGYAVVGQRVVANVGLGYERLIFPGSTTDDRNETRAGIRRRVYEFTRAGKLKRFKRIALRCEKTAQNFAAFVSLVCAFILVKSVHTA